MHLCIASALLDQARHGIATFEKAKAKSDLMFQLQFALENEERGLTQLETAKKNGDQLLAQILENPNSSSPMANRLSSLWERQVIPTSPTNLSGPGIGGELLEAIWRVRMISQSIFMGTQQDGGLRVPYMAKNEARAVETVDAFTAVVKSLPNHIQMQRDRVALAKLKLRSARA